MSDENKLTRAQDLLAFIDASPSPYHAVAECVRRLSLQGFEPLDERESWLVEPGGKYYVVRGGGTLVAFIAGARPPCEAGFLLLGAHSDSPNFRVKPAPDKKCAGYRQLAVEVYGGVLLSTWLDRDLSLAGRLSLRGGKSALVDLKRAILRIPNLAIHLNRTVNTDGLTLNPQQHLMPLFALELDKARDGFKPLLAAELEAQGSPVDAEAILAWDLCLYDSQPACLGGARQEFVFAARLDNLASCHAGLCALTESGPERDMTRAVAIYDHEEVGSQSANGAKSRFLLSVLERITNSYGASHDGAARALARSLLISADMAHAVHPNYAEKHDKQHLPHIGAGPTIKVNANQSYASDAPGIALFDEACQSAGFSAQRFVSRNDMPCGSTIGPISAARMGIRTVDVGNPMLSMHSCREQAGSNDVEKMIRALVKLYQVEALPNPET